MTDQPPTPVTIDEALVRASLTHQYQGVPGLLSICSDADGWAGRRFTTDEAGIADAVQYVIQLDTRQPKGIYAQVTTLRERPEKGRGGKDLAHGLTFLWADGDFGNVGHKPGPDEMPHPDDADHVREIVASSQLPEPSGWVLSGGGFNPMWMLDQAHVITDEDRARVEGMTAGVQTILGAAAYGHGCTWDTQVGNLDRLMRVPGTVNRKGGQARPTGSVAGSATPVPLSLMFERVTELEPAARAALEKAAAEKRARQDARTGRPAVPPPRARTVSTGGSSVFDILAANLTFRDILEPAGWTYRGTSGGRDKWLRPAGSEGSAESDHSLVCDDHVAVNWSERAGLPTGSQPSGRKLTVPTLWAHLHYGGNESEAARDVLRAAHDQPCASPARALPPQILLQVKQKCRPPRADPQAAAVPQHDYDWDALVEPESERTTGGTSVISVRHSQGVENDWEEPLSIDRPTLPPFPVDLLGSNLAAVVEAVTAQVQVAPDIPAMIALAAVSVAVGGRVQVRVRPGWSEAPALWTATVAGAGERKSAAEGPFSDTLRGIERELQAEAIPKIEDAEQQMKIAQARLDDAEKAAVKAKVDVRELRMDEAKLAKRELREMGLVPALPRLLFGDITPAAMPVKAAQQGGRMGVIHSEGTLIKQMGGLYNSGTVDTGFALDAYDGKAMPVDRVGRDSIEMESAHLTIGLLVQPIILEQLGRKKDDEMLHNGFVQRFLYGFPASRLGYQDPRGSIPIPAELMDDLRYRLGRLVHGLWKNTMTQAVTFTDEASEDMYVFQERMQERLRRGGDLHSMASWASKLPGKLARIAALITLYEDPAATQVQAAQLRAALSMAPYFITHARLCLDLMGANRDAKLMPARDVLEWLRRRKDDKQSEPFTVRDAQRGVDGNSWGPDGVTSESVQDAIHVLVDKGWVVPLPAPERPEGQRGRAPSPRFAPHPLVWDSSWKKKEVEETHLRSA
ncbi:YfjI family protein [Streptomyces sp. NPDC001876]|uniref:YfjI family protein n=1 Tax=Streptomyces sp. NPDC001876 TaxID=3154402 RepID=UPI003317FDAA